MAQGTFVISAQNRIKEGLDAAQRDMQGFESATNKIGEALKNAFAVTAIIAGLKKLGEATFDCYKEFGEAERRLNTLKIALGDNAKSIQSATSLIDKMAAQSLASKDDIEALVSELAALGKSDAEIESITTAAVNLSNVTGKDLNSAFTLINATYSGTTGRLKQLLPEIDGLSKEQLAAGEATRLINEKFSTLSQTLAQGDISQNIKNIKDSWSDFKENLGANVAPLFNPLLTGFNALINAINNVMEAKALEAKLDTDITNLEKRNALLRLIAIKEEQIAKQKAYADLILGTDMTGMLSAAGGNSAVEVKVKNTEKELAGIRDKLAKLDAANPNLKYDKGRVVPMLSEGDGSGSGKAKNGYTPTSIDDFYLFGKSLGEGVVDGLVPASQVFQEAMGLDLAAGMRPGESPLGIAASDDFYLFQRGLNSASEGLAVFDQATQEAGNIDLAAAWRGGIGEDGIGITTGAAMGQLTGVTLVSYFDPLAESLAGAIDAGLVRPVAEAAEEFPGNLAQFEESFYLNFERPATMAEELSKAYAGGVDAIGATTGGMVSELVGSTLIVETWADGLSDALGGATDVIDRQFGPAIVAAAETITTDLVTFAESFYLNYAPPVSMASQLGAIYGASGVDMVGGFSGVSLAGSPGASSEATLSTGGTWLGGLMSTITSGIGSAFNTVTAGMGDFASSMLGPLSEIMSALGPFGEMIAGMNPLLALLIPVIEGFVSVIGPAFTAVIQPIMDVLTLLGQTIGQLLLPIFDALAPTLSLVAQIVATVFLPILQILEPVMQVVALMFQMMAPVIGLVAKALIVLMAPVQFIADLFSWLGEVIKTFAWNIMHPFDQREGPGAFVSDAFSGLAERLAKIDEIAAGSQGLQDGYNDSAATASQSANYRVQQITVNIYQNAPVVGEGGMDEFVGMIQTKLGQLAYFGAAA